MMNDMLGSDDDYGDEEGQNFKREAEADYDFM